MKKSENFKGLTRRDFLGRTLAAGSAVALPWFAPARALGRADGIHRYGRVFQAGTQRRSIQNFQHAARLRTAS